MNALPLGPADLTWVLQNLCGLHRRPFSASLLAQQFPLPHTRQTLTDAASTLGLTCLPGRRQPGALHREVFPLVAHLAHPDGAAGPTAGCYRCRQRTST